MIDWRLSGVAYTSAACLPALNLSRVCRSAVKPPAQTPIWAVHGFVPRIRSTPTRARAATPAGKTAQIPTGVRTHDARKLGTMMGCTNRPDRCITIARSNQCWVQSMRFRAGVRHILIFFARQMYTKFQGRASCAQETGIMLGAVALTSSRTVRTSSFSMPADHCLLYRSYTSKSLQSLRDRKVTCGVIAVAVFGCSLMQTARAPAAASASTAGSQTST